MIREADGYRVYTWHHANLEHKNDTNEKREAIEQLWKQTRGRLRQADVQISSFASWEDVGRWYGGLQDERVKPTREVTAKAVELTKNAPNDEAKLRALYEYVSTQFHYIGISFGIGRYQPHSAAEVLANQYGDCKDKHTLLASLLTAVGIPAYPALVSTSREVDEDVPSPGQFDHVVTVVPREGEPVWLDTTTEVGPYRYLVSPLRDKHALVIWKDKAAALLRTPVDLPYEAIQTFNMDAKLNDAGTLEGNVEFSARGDLALRRNHAGRRAPLGRATSPPISASSQPVRRLNAHLQPRISLLLRRAYWLCVSHSSQCSMVLRFRLSDAPPHDHSLCDPLLKPKRSDHNGKLANDQDRLIQIQIP